jgi:predicted RNA-binding Zn-ribbon protein involved in translation (DUF1610 family)
MTSIRTSRLPSDVSFLPSVKSAAVPISCPDYQSDLIYRPKTRRIVESLLAFLRIQPYRCEECGFRFFRWSVPNITKATRPARTTNARNCQRLTPQEASNGGHAPQADMD